MESESTDGATEAPVPPRAAAEPPPHPADAAAAIVRALQSAGVLAELAEEEVGQALGRARVSTEEALLLDLLGQYYAGGGDAETSGRRIDRDRFFTFRDGERANAHMVVQRLSALAPEVGTVSLERIGTDDGPLVIRAGEFLSAVTDHDADVEAGEVDLTDIEEDPRVSIQSLVAAMNVLLDRNGIAERLIQVPGDGAREAYVAMGEDDAMRLCEDGHLEVDDPTFLRELASW